MGLGSDFVTDSGAENRRVPGFRETLITIIIEIFPYACWQVHTDRQISRRK